MRVLFLLMLEILVSCEISGTGEHKLFQATPSIRGEVGLGQLQSFILTPMCIRCHGWVADEAQIRRRVVPGDPDASPLYQKVKDGSMPLGGPALSNSQLRIVAAYIENLTELPPTPVEVPKPTYTSLKKFLFEKSCTMCHQPGRRSPDLTNLESIRANIAEIEVQLDFDLMPPRDENGNRRVPAPTQEVLDAFRQWDEEGLPDN